VYRRKVVRGIFALSGKCKRGVVAIGTATAALLSVA